MAALTFRQQEQLFHELAQLARSGVPLNSAFEILSRTARSRIGACLRAVRDNLQSSGQAGRAFREAGFSESDAAVIEAGEATGRLDVVFLELEDYYRQLADARRSIISKSIYPVLVLHLGAVLLAIPPAITEGGWPAFLAHALPILAAFYAALFAAAVLWRLGRTLLSRDAVAALFLVRIPLFGAFLRDWTAWRYASVLSLYVGAGGSLLRAFEIAGSSCGNAHLNAATSSAIALVQAGQGLSEAFRKQRCIPELLERAIDVGENSGRLDEESRRVAKVFREKTLETLDALAQWTPRILSVVIVLLLGWRILGVASGLANSVNEAVNNVP
ncbi:MAG: type II secretion system F family protein [Terrimicrobiaceae bacterium]